MKWYQKEFSLKPYRRGFHLITGEIESHLPELGNLSIGICQIFIQHTSAGLTINENADSTVRQDFESYFNQAVPENAPYFRHTSEGPDDMPAHLKSALLGQTLSIPITAGRLNLGTWQGIYLCEHRDRAAGRRFVATLCGQ